MLRVMTTLTNTVLDTGVIPLQWQLNQITPIPKKSANSPDPKDYTPICVSSAFQRVLNRCIASRMQDLQQCETNRVPLMNKNQTGYIRGRDWSEAIMTLMEYCKRKSAEGKKVYTLFVNLRNAFRSHQLPRLKCPLRVTVPVPHLVLPF